MDALWCAIVADDFTGACDTGLQLVKAGLRVRVLIGGAGDSGGDADVLVWDTETRNCPADQAAAAVAQAWAGLAGTAARTWYKKVDSTLRGPWPAELRALMQHGDFALALVAPALPEAGRVTVGGWHLVHGVPVARTEMGRDPGAPVRESFLPRLLTDAGLEVHRLPLDVVERGAAALRSALAGLTGVVVLDAASPEDLRSVADAAAALEPVPLLCGSAGLAAHLPGSFGMRARGPAPYLQAGSGPVLVVAGSTHGLTRRQLKAAMASPRLCQVRGLADAEEQLELGRDLLLEPGKTGEGQGPEGMAQALQDLARTTRYLVERFRPVGLVLTGGWTALEVLRELGGQGVDIVSAVGGQVPLCRVNGGPFQGIQVVTKGGALGEEDVLVRAIDQLRAMPAEGRPLLAITLGDPSGIGVEVVVKALAEPEVHRICRPLVVGHPAFLEAALKFVSGGLTLCPVPSPEEAVFAPGQIAVWSPVQVDLAQVTPGAVCPESGRAAVRWVEEAVDLALAGTADAVVTAPLNKEAMRRAGFPFAGHTELLGERTGTREYRMMLTSERLTVVHVTTHLAVRQVPERLSVERVWSTLVLTRQALVDLGIDRPRVAVAGLNPHAGESGLFGDEDREVIGPAVDRARQEDWDVSGPLPPDTVFLRASQGEFDAVVAMYHDQGHIPAKLLAFTEAVNVTLGLPIIRTSVDHGTAFDLVGKGVADHRNMMQAIRLAARLARGRARRAT